MTQKTSRPPPDPKLAIMRKTLRAWFREHRPDTPDVRVKVGRYPDGVFIDVSYAPCEGRSSLHLTDDDMKPAVTEAIKQAGLKEDVNYEWRQRHPRATIVYVEDDGSEDSGT